jgi:hypothetical protein
VRENSPVDALDTDHVDVQEAMDVLGREGLDVTDVEVPCVVDDRVEAAGVFERRCGRRRRARGR